VRLQAVHEGVRRLKLAVPGPLGEIAGDDDDVEVERGQERLQRLDLRQIRVPAEVQIGQVGDDRPSRGHLTIRCEACR
jgi:hypothetical protein